MKAFHWVLILATLAVLAYRFSGYQNSDSVLEVYQPPVANLQRHWQIPDFSLTERSGKIVKLADLHGKVWVADFFYTTCPGPCPMMTSRLSQLHQDTAKLSGVNLVSISADPEKDTPEVLTQYAKKFGADERWLFLTGSKSEVYELANKGFKLSVTSEGGTKEEPVTHSTKLLLVDKNGTVRGFYEALTSEGNAKLLSDIETLLKETR